MTITVLPSFRRPTLLAHSLLALALALPAGLRAEEPPANPPSVSEKTSEAFSKLGPLNDAKNWDGMLAVLDAVAPTVDPMSYDMFKIQDMRAGINGRKDQNAKAIEAWEAALAISDVKHYYDAKDLQQTLLYLAQFSYMEGTASKDVAVQQKYTTRAVGYFKRYLQNEKKPSSEIEMFYASLLYNQAVSDPKKADPELLQQASAEVQKALMSTVHPKEQLYMLQLAILQQQNDLKGSADALEMILQQYPNKKDYWTALQQTYLAIASEKDQPPDVFRQYYIRAINTVERAQALGFLSTPKDNLYLVNLYLILNQFGKGTELLHKGLKQGTIESDVKNWLMLGYYYQQANEESEAIAALKDAAVLFPSNGQIDLTIAEIYRGKDLLKEARQYYRIAIKKGGLEKPHLVLAYLANAAFSLEDFDEAKAAVDEVYKNYPAEAAKDTFLPQLKAMIESSIADREAQKTQRP